MLYTLTTPPCSSLPLLCCSTHFALTIFLYLPQAVLCAHGTLMGNEKITTQLELGGDQTINQGGNLS